jgi:hypothetical protein
MSTLGTIATTAASPAAAVGAAVVGGAAQGAASDVGSSILSALGLSTASVGGVIMRAALWLVFVVAGVALVFIGFTRLTGTHPVADTAEVAGDAGKAAAVAAA